MKEIDHIAKFEVERKFVLPSCLHLPVAARDKASLSKYIGDIIDELSRTKTDNAFLVNVPSPTEIDNRLPIWENENSFILNKELQVWVNVDYKNYRAAYKRAFPDEVLESLVLDHIMNRRAARLKGFKYLRIVPVSRAVNSSSAFSENWGVAYNKTESMKKVNAKELKNIQYADLTDIVKMLNIKPGGGIMETVNIAQKLVDIEELSSAL